MLEGKKNIIHFHSLTFTQTEKKGLGSLQKELLGLIRTISLNKRIIHSHPSKIILITDCQAILKLHLLAESTNNTKLTRWLNILETLVENHITILWRSSKNPEITCADYLSRFTADNKHDNIYIKFSNKLPRLREEDLENEDITIPERYKLNDAPITFKDLINIFKAAREDGTNQDETNSNSRSNYPQSGQVYPISESEDMSTQNELD